MANRSSFFCEICERMGKQTCGFHQYKANFKFDTHSPNKFADTGDTFHRKSEIKQNKQTLFTPQTSNMKVQIRPFTPTQSPQKIVQRMPQQNGSMNNHQRKQNYLTVPNQKMGPNISNSPYQTPVKSKVMVQQISPIKYYYPIYPVYEVVYEPSSHSRHQSHNSSILHDRY